MQLKQIRNSKKMTIKALSMKSSVPTRTIEDIERTGRCLISTAIKLADALGVSLDTLCR